jgi:phosphate transport system substrate-binding protein
MRLRAARWGIVLAAACHPGSPCAEQGALLEWVVPVPATNAKQTAEQEELGRRLGRALPAPEILQPTLDAALVFRDPECHPERSAALTVAVSDTLPGLVSLWVDGFRAHCPNVRIALAPLYDGNSAAQRLLEGKVDIAFISRALKPGEVTAFRERFGHEQASIPVASGSYRHFGFADALAIFVNRNNPLERITYAQFDAIYSSTHRHGRPAITTWGQLGLKGAWANRPIHPYGIKPWDGFEDLLRQKVLSVGGQRGEWSDAVRNEGVFSMARRIAGDVDSIGYGGVAYLDADVKVLAIGEDATSSFRAPTYESVADASYPLTRAIFANVNPSSGAGLDPVLEEFLRYVMGREGQRIVLDQAIFLPLRASQAAEGPSKLVGILQARRP